MPADVATAELFEKFETELKASGFSLDNTARIRVWGRDKDARTLATAARSKILTGNRKAASSSFISLRLVRFGRHGRSELLAMRPVNRGAERRPVDFKPARNYLCYLDYQSLLFFSGFTSDAALWRNRCPTFCALLPMPMLCPA